MIDISTVADFALDSFNSLGTNSVLDGARMPAAWLPGRDDALFAKAASGEFFLMLKSAGVNAISERRTNSLRVNLGSTYLLEDVANGNPIEFPFGTVALEPGNDQLVFSFGLLAGVLLAGLAVQPSLKQIEQFLNDFIELFAPKRTVEKDTVVGLWGELWMITQAHAPSVLAQGWHSQATGRYDFSLSAAWIEVKTTELKDRIHNFSLAQLEPQLKPTWIASVTVVPDPIGQSIADLLSTVTRLVSVDLGARTSRIAVQTLAGDLESASDFRFAASGAKPLALVEAKNVPRVLVPDVSTISDVRFRANLNAQADQSTTSLDDLLGV